MKNQRPKHLALHLIRLPLPGIISILHRVSGLILFFAIPAVLWLFQYSLGSKEGFTSMMSCLSHTSTKLILLVLIWAGMHHFFAGLRFLAIDAHAVKSLAHARFTSKLVLVLSILCTVILGVQLW